MKLNSVIGVLLLMAVVVCAQTASATQSVIVAWDPNPEPDIVGYNVYYRDSAATQTSTGSVTNSTTATMSGLLEGHTYTFYVTAVNSSALESDPSDSVSYSVHSVPALALIPDQAAQVGVTFTLTPSATDSDPGQTLTFALLPGAPVDATLDPRSGLFTWTPSLAYAWTINSIGIQVTDNGVPPRTASSAFNLAVQAPDSDGDGIPDWYERLVGLNPLDPSDGDMDADGDGFSNLAEFEAGTDPNDASSALRILSVAALGKDVVIQFSSVPGKQYRVEGASDSQQSSPWTVVADSLTATNSTTAVTDLDANLEPERFYRVIVGQ